jgi:hypothetical protein
MEAEGVAAISTIDRGSSNSSHLALPDTVQLVLDAARVDTLDATFEALVAVLRGPSARPVFEPAEIARPQESLSLQRLDADPDWLSAFVTTTPRGHEPVSVAPITHAPVTVATAATRPRNERGTSNVRSLSLHVFAPMALVVIGLAVVMVLIG